jgi:NCS1 family nucleobase:cation symporter-1
MVVDYFWVRKGNVHVPSLYDSSKRALYMFRWYGSNPRAIFSWTGGMLMGLPGLVAAYRPDMVGASATRMYSMAWILTTLMTSFLYVVACWIWPVQVYPSAFAERLVKFEYLAATDGYFDVETHRNAAAQVEEGVAGLSDDGSVGDIEIVHDKEKDRKV